MKKINKNGYFLWAGRVFSNFGDQIHEITIILIIWEITGSSTYVAIVTFLSRAPFWLFGWLGGIVADHKNKKMIVIIMNGFSAALLLSTFMLFSVGFRDSIYVALVAFVAFSSSVARSFEVPALISQLPDLLPDTPLNRANGLLDNTKRIARLLAPAISAVTVALSTTWLYLISGLAYLIMASCAVFIRTPIYIAKKNMPWATLKPYESIRYFITDAAFMRILIFSGFYAISHAACYFIFLPRIAITEIGGGASLYSMMILSYGIGGLIGNLSTSIFPWQNYYVRVGLGMVISGLAFSVLGVTTSIIFVFLVCTIGGSSIPLMDMSMQSLIHSTLPKSYWGRAFALWRYIAEAGLAIGLLAAGPLADRMDPRTGILFMGIGAICTGAALILFVPISKKNISGG